MPTNQSRTVPDQVADQLIARILVGELAAGTRLPPERTLAAELGVDRTSLRTALRQLKRMNLVQPVQGSGITVLDAEAHAGIDFLGAALANEDLQLGSTFLLEALDVWVTFLPAAVEAAATRAGPRDLHALDGVFAKQLALVDAGASLDAIADLEVEVQDVLMRTLGSFIMSLFANSTRELRRHLVRAFFATTDPRAHVEATRGLLVAVVGGALSPEDLGRTFRDYLREVTQPLRQHIASLPTRSTLEGPR